MGNDGDDVLYDYDEIFDADDYEWSYDSELGFSNYKPWTNDPGPYALVVTVLYCFLLIGLFPLFIAVRQRLRVWRKRQKEAKRREKAEMNEAQEIMQFTPLKLDTVHSGVSLAQSSERGASVESLYFEVDGLTVLDTRHFPNQLLILTSAQHPTTRASKRPVMGEMIRSTWKPLRRLAQRLRRRGSAMETLAAKMDPDETSQESQSASSSGEKDGSTYVEKLSSVDDGKQSLAGNEHQSYSDNGTRCSSSELHRSSNIEALPPATTPSHDVQLAEESSGSHSGSGGDPPDEDMINSFIDDLVDYEKEAILPVEQTTASKSAITTPANKYEIDIYKGPRPFFRYFCSKGFWRKVRKCSRWDGEMVRILKLAGPFTLHAIATDVCELLEVIVISQLLGTANLSAFFAVEFMVTLGTMVMDGMFQAPEEKHSSIPHRSFSDLPVFVLLFRSNVQLDNSMLPSHRSIQYDSGRSLRTNLYSFSPDSLNSYDDHCLESV